MPKPKASERRLRRQELAERRQHDRKRAAGKTEADQYAGGDIEHRRAGRLRHQRQARGVKQRADAEHPHRAEAVGDDAAERLADAPQQILQRQRKGEDVAAPVIGARQRREEEAERRARPERDERDQAAEADDQRRRAPIRARGGALVILVMLVHVAPAIEKRFRKPRSIKPAKRSPKRKLSLMSAAAHG